MLTYDLNEAKGPLYLFIYNCIKTDILEGRLSINEKMPSKRNLAHNLGVSIITIENAYEQLMSEGYIYSIPKKGYFISDILDLRVVSVPVQKTLNIDKHRGTQEMRYDFISNRTGNAGFPFSVWAKLMRDVISNREKDLLTVSPCEGVRDLREAIANHLSSFRGMAVDPDQIIIGAGTEYLYGLLVKLLGNESTYCIENPGYKKLASIYQSNGVECKYVDMDEKGVTVEQLRKAEAEIIHISPTHHFPTGITMPVSRRYEILAWANESSKRYIIEDDYDSEFRLNGKPIASLQSIDANEKVIYMNTFSKSLTSTIRISYMVLPEHLANEFYKKLSFYSNTVSTFEQYTLAAFISQGYFEKHINRMRLRYGRKRTQILETIKETFEPGQYKIIENDSGLHFLIEFNCKEKNIKKELFVKKIKIGTISDYYMNEPEVQNYEMEKQQFILNYSSIDEEELKAVLEEIKALIS